MITAPLDIALRSFSMCPRILVACDYDGTLAEIVDDPTLAVPRRDALDALRRLQRGPGTEIAIVSGRARAELARLSGLDGEAHLIGSHGSEWADGQISDLDPRLLDVIDQLTAHLEGIATRIEGVRLEHKPASVAVHHRAVAAADQLLLDVELDLLGRRFPEAREQRGLLVREFGVADWDKGRALDRLRVDLGVEAVLFIGDDFTDEHGFAQLRAPDIGVKVGPGPTLAAHRVPNPAAAAAVLASVAEHRKSMPHR